MCTNKASGRRNRNVREKVERKHEEIDKLYLEDQRINLNDESFDKSSSSSLSWGEDCEQEATQRVKNEYEKMHRVLKGLDLIPPNYDKDEYKLWIRTFPTLRSSIKINSTRKRSYPTTPMSSRVYTKPVQPVIDEFLTKLCHKLSHPKPKRPQQRERRKTVDNPSEMLERDFENLLRISPAPILTKSGTITRNFLNCTTEEEYTSLPYLTPKMEVGKSTNSNINRKRRPKNLVLPPIEMGLNQFRSVSAFPLQKGKCLSAISNGTNLNFDLKEEEFERNLNNGSNLNSARNLKFLN